MALGLGNAISKDNFPLSSEDNYSLLFDGTNDEVDFTSEALQAAMSEGDGAIKRSGSVSIWLKMGASIGTNGQLFDLCINTSNRIFTQYKHSANGFTATFKGGGGQVNNSFTPGSSIEGDDTWHHLVMTWDKGTDNEQKLYFDGALKNTSSLGSVEIAGDFDDEATSEGVEIIQGTSFNGNADYKGHLDDFAIFSNVLTLARVQALYNSGKSLPNDVANQGTLIAHWKFNEGTGVITTDSVAGYVGTFGSSGKNPTFVDDNAAA